MSLTVDIARMEDIRNKYKDLVRKPETDHLEDVCLINYHAMKTYWGSEVISPRILNLDIRWR
jgi:hypothetical protein